ncbi:unnamed protein product [Rotaria sp. Silwood2]|nr:unnamed protein product [Rotaria sp. Silwood2]CAF4363340.1 unnamed protein product [Rotaria sp. Silwood2]
MSTENEKQTESIPTCGICEAIVVDDDTKVICTYEPCSKLTCLSCIQKMIEVMFSQPTLNYPFKCGSCLQIVDQRIIHEIIVKQRQYEKYIACIFPLYWAKDCLDQNEILAQCPFCPYFEIYTIDACPLHFFTCQHPSCGKKSCLICLHAVDDTNESIHQSYCVELRTYKKMIEKAIESGSQQHCPYCQLTGIKDDGCTHMVCQRCKCNWCYLCGMKENECKVGNNVQPSLSAHNEDWESNEGRCPMSLISIHELDIRWPENDQDCLEYFHRYRTVSHLFNVLKLIGEEKFNEVNQYFGIIDASGYTVQEIKDYENRIFIDYTSKGNE